MTLCKVLPLFVSVLRAICFVAMTSCRSAQRFPALKKAVQDHLNALPGSADELAGLLQETRDQLQQSQQRDEAPQLDEKHQAAATLLHLMEVPGALWWCETIVGLFQISQSQTMPGGVPLYLRQIFLKYLPKRAPSKQRARRSARNARRTSGRIPLPITMRCGEILTNSRFGEKLDTCCGE